MAKRAFGLPVFVLVRPAPGWGGFVGDAFAGVVDHRYVDHGFGAGGQGLVVTDEAAVEHEPSEGALDYPASLEDVEAAGVGIAMDDLGVDAQGGGVVGELLLEAGIDPGHSDRRMVGLGLVQDLDAGLVLRDGRGTDGHGQQQAERVGGDTPFAADDLLRGVRALRAGRWVGGGLHGLGVDGRGGRFRVAAVLGAGQAGQRVVELGEDALVSQAA